MGMKKLQSTQVWQRGTIGLKRVAVLLFSCVLFVMLAACCEDRSVIFLASGEEMAKESDVSEEEPTEEAPSVIYVHVCGAVKSPGLYEFPEGTRAWDAILAAGGFAQEAQEDYLNLAAVLKDGQKLYVPKQGETVSEEAGGQGDRIDLNAADAKALCTLPGIGETRAQAILKYRKEHGNFEKTEDLMKVPGIKEGLYEQIKEFVVVKDD